MKTFSFNMITTLWVIVISIASCAFINSTTQKRKTSNSPKLQPPSEQFLLQLEKENECLEDNNSERTHCYDFRFIDFQDYEPATYENIFSTYRSLFSFSKFDEVIPITEKKVKTSKVLGTTTKQKFQQFHKGVPVHTLSGTTCEIKLSGDSTGSKLRKVAGSIVPNLNVDTIIKISTNEAFQIAKSSIPLGQDEYFTYEQSLESEQKYRKDNPALPPFKNLKIYVDKLAYSFIFVKQEQTGKVWF